MGDTINETIIEARTETKKQTKQYTEVKVWDVPTRILHWALAFLTLGLIGTMVAKEALEDSASKNFLHNLEELHAVFGHFLAIVFILRIVWGFFGNEYIRWKDFNPFTKEKLKIAKANLMWYASFFQGEKPPVTLGHNPLASIFYVALFLVLVSQILTGLLLSGIELNMGPATLITDNFSPYEKENMEEFLEEIHEFGFAFINFFIVAHLIGIVAHTLFDKVKIATSMITGKKQIEKE